MAVAAIAALSSCSDNDSIENATSGKEPVKQTLVFTATMEGAPQSRATYNSEHKCAAWEVNDQIIINGYLFLAQASGTSTTFSQLLEHEKRPIYVSSESNGFSNNEAPIMLVDESGTNTKWCANTSHKNGKTAWNIIVRTERPVKLHAIKLWNGGDTDEYPDRRWKKIKVLGGAQESACDNAIGTFGNLNLEANKGGFAGTIDVNATSAYEYYKIEVQEIEGGDVMQMSDMTFVYEDEKIDNAPFHAYFPATLYDGTTAVLPSQITEEWTDSKFNMPMYASSETTDLQFKNLCGVLKITVNDEDLASVKSITVSSANCATSGAFTVNAENAAELSYPSDASKSVTVTYNTAVETDAEGKVFYIPVPAQTYRDLVIKVSDDSRTVCMTTRNGVDIVVERNKIYPITFVEDKFVDLGLSVLWARCNLGAQKQEEYGAYFQWAGTIDMKDYDPGHELWDWSTCPYHIDGNSKDEGWTKYVSKNVRGAYWAGAGEPDNKLVLDSEDDAAYVLLGGACSIPSYRQWNELEHYCEWSPMTINGIDGFKVQSKKEGYTNNWIFFPLAGIWENGTVKQSGGNWNNAAGYYWINSVYMNEPYNAVCTRFSLNDISVTWSAFRSRALPIRPVCAKGIN